MGPGRRTTAAPDNPMRLPPGPSLQATSLPRAGPARRGPDGQEAPLRVLVVDDFQDQRETLAVLLQAWGWPIRSKSGPNLSPRRHTAGHWNARSHEAGFNAHLTKPADLTELQRLLATAMARVA